jgi:hypothetical protein
LPKENILDFTITRLDGKGSFHSAIPSFQQFKEIAASPDLRRFGTVTEIERAIIAALTYERSNAHIFVTNDAFLLDNKKPGFLTGSFPTKLSDAIALIGLIQRKRNNYKIIEHRVGDSTITYSHARWLFFLYASRDLLPAAWKLVTGCAQMQGDKYRNLALAAIVRTSSALKCRDNIHEQLFLDQSNSSTEDAIFYLDFFLVCFTAAFDVLARIADGIYQPTTSRGRRIGKITWRGEDWLNRLSIEDPLLAALMQPSSFSRDVLDFIASLRNYIHEEGLHGSMHRKNGKPAPLLLHIPKTETIRIDAILRRLNGGKVIEYQNPDDLVLKIGDLVEWITPLAVQALNNIMQAIDITRIPNYDPSMVQTGAPTDWPKRKQLDEIRSLLGL